MKTYYDPISSTTTTSSNENIRFKSTFIKLVDDITSMATSHDRDNLNHSTNTSNKLPSSKINNYKFQMLMNKDKSDINLTHGLYSPKSKSSQNLHIYFDKMKLDNGLKSKYKNILENGLISIKTGEYEKYEMIESI